tara:strand:- start:1403 stop:1573 length:171 start_codon:yes stop_codon:yes gene_type:complete
MGKSELLPFEDLDDISDELWIELISNSPKSVEEMCMVLSINLQIKKEWMDNKIRLD